MINICDKYIYYSNKCKCISSKDGTLRWWSHHMNKSLHDSMHAYIHQPPSATNPAPLKLHSLMKASNSQKSKQLSRFESNYRMRRPNC